MIQGTFISRSIRHLSTGLLVLASTQIWAAPATTVVEAVQKAIATNPDVEAQWHKFLSAEDDQKSARGGYFPSVDLNAAAGYEHHDIYALNQKNKYDIGDISLQITQLLYDGFATSSNVDRLERVKRERYFELLSAADNTALDAIKAYEDVNRYRELVALSQTNVDRHREVLSKIQERVSAGVGKSVDLEQATGRLALAESNLVVSQSNLHDVSTRYQRIVGEWPAEELAPSAYDNANLPADVSAALNIAYQDHPALAAATENIRANEEQLRNRRAKYQPRVDVRLRGEYGNDIDRITGHTRDGIAEVVMSYNLFNGGADKAAIGSAANLITVAEDNREATCREVRQVLRIAYNDHIRIGKQLDYLKVHKDTTDKARTAYLNQFQLGQRTLLDLLDTENEYFESQRAYVNGMYDYAISTARTLAGMGHILPAVGASRKDLPTLASLGGEEGNGPACPAEPPTPPIVSDDDHDGVKNQDDLCPETPFGVQVDGAGCAHKEEVILHGVNFAFDSTRLTGDSKITLDKVARILRANADITAEVAGHTDSVGTDAYNLKLSQGRAQSVVDYLVSQGVSALRLHAKGYGESQPKTDNDSPEHRAINRRVEFRIIDNTANPAPGSDASNAPAPMPPTEGPAAPPAQ